MSERRDLAGDNPIIAEFRRAGAVESIHRGAWVLVDGSGQIIESVGDPGQFVFGRSSTKSFQALPLLESGAADAFGLGSEAIATALASHSGEDVHRRIVGETLAAIGLDESHLRCGPQRPFSSPLDARAERILNNCSGKHAGFLAVSQYRGEDPAHYLDADGLTQSEVRQAVAQICGVAELDITGAVDGCSAPTFQMPLAALATGIARITNPASLDPARRSACGRMTDAAAAHPVLVAGSRERIDTDLLAVTNGRIFPKIGAEGVEVVGIVGADRGLAIKIDDGTYRGFYALLIHLLRRFGLLDAREADALDQWGSTVIRNWDGLAVGEITFPEEI